MLFRHISALLIAWGVSASYAQAAEPAVPFRIQLDTITRGFNGRPYDGTMCYAQARAGIVPRAGRDPLVVVTMSPLKLSGSDVYFELHEMRTEDLGRTWVGPFKHPQTLGRRPAEKLGDKLTTAVVCDYWPKWHAKSGKLLGTGQSLSFIDDAAPVRGGPRSTTFSVYDAEQHVWSKWDAVALPEGKLSYACGAGCTQRVDLPNGEILLPVYYRTEGNPIAESKVLRCGFDGRKLTLLEEGPPLTLPTKRGLGEPSLARFNGRFYLTLRHDDAGYVTSGDDGLHFGPIKKWTWDDAAELGTYNTQSHWVTHSDALYLVYTRRGANNDHVFRHRAPLFIAEVDVARLQVKKATEQILIPEKGCRYGNFGVCDVNEHETWIVETEWMQRPPEEPVIPVKNRWGAEARVYAARILWSKPNRIWDAR